MLDGVDPGVVDEILHVANKIKKVRDVTKVRIRWLGTDCMQNSFSLSLNVRLSNPGYFCAVVSCPGKHDSPANGVVKHFLDFSLKLPAF